MKKSVVGYLLLAGMTLTLFIWALTETYRFHGRFVAYLSAILILPILISEGKREFLASVLTGEKSEFLNHRDAYNVLFVISAALATFFLNAEFGLGLGPVVAASLVGIAAALAKPAYGAPAFCGSFVGMACGATFSTVSLLLAAILAGLLYVLSSKIFKGFGGKLGTIAFFGCVTAALLSRHGFATTSMPSWQLTPYLVTISIFAAVATYFLSVRLKLDVVLSSGLIGLAAGIALPFIAKENGAVLATMAFCASFAGMSGRLRIVNEAYMAIAGVVCAAVFIYSSTFWGGAGGKLGTIAFGSVIFVFGMRKILNSLSRVILPEWMLLRPVINVDKCIQCNQCAAMCPVKSIEHNNVPFATLNPRSCTGCLNCIDACKEGAVKFSFGRMLHEPSAALNRQQKS